ncbi:MAG: galactose mutarotase [Candidatus Nealsonbacteria bacterium]|nr:galactose mutarotase [Candidatus Nealsonbacteria bacterium]
MKRSSTRRPAVVLGLAALVALGCLSSTTISSAAGSDAKMNIEKTSFGKTKDGTEVDRYTLTNDNGLKVGLITFGAMMTSVEVPDRDGKFANVTLFRDTLDDYIEGHPYFGCVAGRYANRIAKGKFTLDGKEYSLTINNDANHLHGGEVGFDKHVWKAKPIEADGSVGVRFSLTSPDGDQGYPGTLEASVTYSLNNDNELKMDYKATTDKPTVLNLTNHAYWNLAGAGSGDVLGHRLMINGDRYLPCDDELIPTGKVNEVKDTPMDFTKPKKVGARIDQVEGGYDHCYVLKEGKGKGLTLCARLVDPGSGRVMEIRTSQPAVQLYTGNFLEGKISGGGVAYQKHFALCLETQHYPDSPNQPKFPSTVLRPGEKYHQVTVHKFKVKEKKEK